MAATQVLELAAPGEPGAGRQRAPRRAMRCLRVGDERADVAAAHVGLHDDAPLAVLAADLIRAFVDARPAWRALSGTKRRAGRGAVVAGERQRAPAARRRASSSTGRCSSAWRSWRARLGQADDDVEAPVALEDLPGGAAADGDGDDVVHVGDGQAVARHGAAVDVDAQHRRAGRPARRATSAAPGMSRRIAAMRSAAGSSVSNSSPNTLTATSAAHAGEQLVEAHLDRLR